MFTYYLLYQCLELWLVFDLRVVTTFWVALVLWNAIRSWAAKVFHFRLTLHNVQTHIFHWIFQNSHFVLCPRPQSLTNR